ncbi:MAG: hypothetical protein CMF72_19960 [Mameliella sp.]|nr:hypothetical protein [Mameliella sp.]|tara:strand:- start:2356 stop:2793 length:438 start_codon:yes stop_codon:yes gene_type:complete
MYDDLKHGKLNGSYGFLAMKFGDTKLEEFASATIKKSCAEDLGYEIQDVRDIAQAGIIDNILREQIRGCKFAIVDLTHDNPGAYWEAGYAEGLGKPVIYICERNKFSEKKTHFDTNHCTTVLWDSSETEHFRDEFVATVRRSLGQ